jgi:hypothetical protein
VTFSSEEAKEAVYRKRHTWCSNGGSSLPRLVIDHDLTDAQQELRQQLFPIQQHIHQQGVKVRMQYYPTVLLVVAGRECHTVEQAERAAAAHQHSKGLEWVPYSSQDQGAAAGSGAATANGSQPGRQPVRAGRGRGRGRGGG